MKHAHVPGEKVKDLPTFFNLFCPDYIGRTYRPLVVKIGWTCGKYSAPIAQLSASRAQKRIATYLIPDEVLRVRLKLNTKDNASIRFGGADKVGHGYRGERGDFCLVGGSIRGNDLALFYRRLELVGGFAFDVCLIDELARQLSMKWRTVQLMCVQADMFALKDGSGEKERLFANLQEIYR